MNRFLLLATLAAGAFAKGSSWSSSNGVEVEAQTSSSSSSETISITIVAVNDGGSSSTTQVNSPTYSQGAVHQVTVGGTAGLVYTPDTISAAVGDMVQFNFMSTNHTVTQSSFAAPCVKAAGGADSGFMPNANNTVNPPPMMMFQVTSTDPIWMYCRQKGHCGKGMVFSINPTAAKSQADFQAMAIAQNGTSTASTASTSTAASATAAAATSSSTSDGSVVAGTGSTSSGTCTCSCLCGTAAFPEAAVQGVGMMGGMSGSISAAQVGTMGKRAVALIS